VPAGLRVPVGNKKKAYTMRHRLYGIRKALEYEGMTDEARRYHQITISIEEEDKSPDGLCNLILKSVAFSDEELAVRQALRASGWSGGRSAGGGVRVLTSTQGGGSTGDATKTAALLSAREAALEAALAWEK
jgi:hypothetical protein